MSNHWGKPTRTCRNKRGFASISWDGVMWGLSSSFASMEDGERVFVLEETESALRVARLNDAVLDLPRLEFVLQSVGARFMPVRFLKVDPRFRGAIFQWFSSIEPSFGFILTIGDLSCAAGLSSSDRLPKAETSDLEDALRDLGMRLSKKRSERERLEMSSWKTFLKSVSPAPQTLSQHHDAFCTWVKLPRKKPDPVSLESKHFEGRPLTPEELALHADGKCISCGMPATRHKVRHEGFEGMTTDHECAECWKARTRRATPSTANLSDAVNPRGRASLSREYKNRLGYAPNAASAPNKPEDE